MNGVERLLVVIPREKGSNIGPWGGKEDINTYWSCLAKASSSIGAAVEAGTPVGP